MKTIEEYKREWLASRERLPGLSLAQVKAMSIEEWAAYFGGCRTPNWIISIAVSK